MQKIADEEKQRIKNEKNKKRSMHQSKKDVSKAFSPIDLLKDLEFRRGVQPAFKSTTRNNWQVAHASKTNPPDVGKYTPKYDALDSDQKATVFVKEHD
jgi:hypothetical protein